MTPYTLSWTEERQKSGHLSITKNIKSTSWLNSKERPWICNGNGIIQFPIRSWTSTSRWRWWRRAGKDSSKIWIDCMMRCMLWYALRSFFEEDGSGRFVHCLYLLTQLAPKDRVHLPHFFLQFVTLCHLLLLFYGFSLEIDLICLQLILNALGKQWNYHIFLSFFIEICLFLFPKHSSLFPQQSVQLKVLHTPLLLLLQLLNRPLDPSKGRHVIVLIL